MLGNLRVTLIVTTYNWPAALDLTLRSAARQSMAPAEIIVADDGSGQETRELIAGWQQRLKTPLLHMWQADEGFRLARSRNRAIAAAAARRSQPDVESLILRSSIDGGKAWCPLGLSQHPGAEIPGMRRSPAATVSELA